MNVSTPAVSSSYKSAHLDAKAAALAPNNRPSANPQYARNKATRFLSRNRVACLDK
jgi:hypothetical protein